MASTTIKLSVETRERLRALDGATYEDTVIEAGDIHLVDVNQEQRPAESPRSWLHPCSASPATSSD